MSELHDEFQHYVDRHGAFVEKYSGRVIVLKGSEVLGDFDTVETAYWYVVEHNLLGSVLIQQVGDDDSDYTLTVNSHLIFA